MKYFFRFNIRLFNMYILALIVLILMSGHGNTATAGNLNHELPADYIIDAVLDTSSQMLYGHESVRFYNLTNHSLDVIVFHLYPNAFKDMTTLMASENKHIKAAIIQNSGFIECDSITIDGNPPDSIRLEETLLYLYPAQKLSSGSISEIKMKFEIKIPKLIMRYGYDDNGNYLLSHWHPILAGYQKGKPVVFDYSINTEFFSNFSNYLVNLTLPENFALASTAGINEPDSVIDRNAFFAMSAEQVIDFAFVCGTSWMIDEFTHNETDISILYFPKNKNKLVELKKAITGSLDYFSGKLFEYPYKNLVFVDFNPGAGGMELPGMVIMPYSEGRRGKWGLIMTAIHEMAHQWFYAAIATNEADEPWLDEGFASYLTDRAMEHIYGQAAMIDRWGVKASFTDFSTLAVRLSKSLDALTTSSNKFHGNSYFLNVYGRATATIKTLEGVLGKEKFDDALKDFAKSYRFKHPDTYDLLESFENSTGQNLEWFFNDYIFGTARVDYEVVSIKSTKLTEATSDDTGNSECYETVVEVQRHYDGVLPQKIVVGYDNGETVGQDWDGEEKYKLFRFESDTPAVWAAIDTDYCYLIDENLANNSRKAQQESLSVFAFASSLCFIMQMAFSMLGLL